MKPHSHPCADCKTPTDCDGPLEQNHDGWPAVICRDYHLDGGEINHGFLCEACHDAAERQLAIDLAENV